MPMTANTNNYDNAAFDDSCEKAHASAAAAPTSSSSSRANKDNLYCNWQQLPSAAVGGAVGGDAKGNDEYEQFEMYESLQDDPLTYEVVEPRRPLPRPKPH